MGSDFGGSNGAFENRGDLGKREFLESAEQQHLAGIAIKPR